jgi:hypothetical protein
VYALAVAGRAVDVGAGDFTLRGSFQANLALYG